MVEIKGSPGDYVKLRLAREEVEGVLLESYDKGVLLLKLKSGYNIGILRENVLDLKILRKFKDNTYQLKKDSYDNKLIKSGGHDGYEGSGGSGERPKIGLIVTGGTIASKLDSRTGAVSALTDVNEFRRFYPGLFEKYDIKEIEVPFMCLSENMEFRHWKKIAESVEKMLNRKEIKGVVITHGTDTLHYTSAALSFFLRDLNKPVVLTYAQRSIDRASSDAELNLQCAAEMALSDCAEVVLVGHATMEDDFCYAFPGTKTRKMHTSRRDAFKPVNAKPIAKISAKEGVDFFGERRPRNEGNVKLDCEFSDKVVLVKFYPGQDPDILDYYMNKGYKGIIIEMTGLGHVASSEARHSWVNRIKRLVKKGIVVCAAAQTIYGRLNSKVYSTGRELESAGVLFLEDMLAETAFVKLGWILGHRNWKGAEKIKEKMLGNFAGEFNELLSE